MELGFGHTHADSVSDAFYGWQICIELCCSDQTQASAAACCSSVRRFLFSTPDGTIRMHALRLAARVCARWSGEGLTQGWDALLLYAMQASRTCEALVLALECLVHHLVRSPAREEDSFARQGGYALVQDLLCSKSMSEELQLSCYTLLMHLLLRTPPPVGAVTPFPPDDSSIVLHPNVLKVCHANAFFLLFEYSKLELSIFL